MTGWKAGPTQEVAMIDHTDMGDLPAGTPEVLHYLHDVLGSVVALTDSNGAVVERYDYDPYGATYILDPAGVPRQLLPVDPWAADGYFHDHDQDGDLDAADYADLVACANDTPYDPLGIYSHGERSERRGVAGPSCPPPTDEGGLKKDMVGRNSAQGCKRLAPRPARRRVGTRLAAGGRNGDRRVDHVDVGAYLAHADSNGLVGPPAGMVNYGRPLRLPFDADGDGRIDLFDWYALQTCYDRATTRCNHLFDADASALVDGPDLEAFRASAEPPYSGPPSKPWRRQLVASRYGNPFMWTGQRRDATTGQYHFWARTYSPHLGRWLQRDPVEYVDGMSLYSYVTNAPLRYVDSLGFWPDSNFWYDDEDGRNSGVKVEPTSAGGSSTSPTKPDKLVFDGKKICQVSGDGEKCKKCWSAVSGQKGETDTSVPDNGPIPEGEWKIPSNRETDPAKRGVWNTDDWNKNRRRPGWIRKGTNPKPKKAWGNWSTRIEPKEGTDTKGRSGFNIHGGENPGSAGCIDLTCGDDDFFDDLINKGQGKDVGLTVDYSGESMPPDCEDPEGCDKPFVAGGE